MLHSDLEHLLRAAMAVTGEKTFYVVGTAALLGSISDESALRRFLNSPPLLRSREADLIPMSGSLQSVDLIDGALGLESQFDTTFGYHADGVEFTTVSTAPSNWRERAIPFSSPATLGAVGLCMEANDLAVTKLCAGREKDLEFVEAMLSAKLADPDVMYERLATVAGPAEILNLARHRLAGLAGKGA